MDGETTTGPLHDGELSAREQPAPSLLGDGAELDGLAAHAERLGEPSNPAVNSEQSQSWAGDSQWQAIDGYASAPVKRRGLLWLLMLIALALLALNVHLAYEGQLLLRTGQVTSVERGALSLRITSTGPWSVATVGRTVPQGASLQAREPTVATIEFFDGSLMRTESAGEWEIVKLQGSRSYRTSRVTIRQYWGTASYVAAPLRAGYNNSLQIQVPRATLELTGAARLASDCQGLTKIRILQGHGLLTTGGYTYRLRAGQVAQVGEGKLLAVEGDS